MRPARRPEGQSCIVWHTYTLRILLHAACSYYVLQYVFNVLVYNKAPRGRGCRPLQALFLICAAYEREHSINLDRYENNGEMTSAKGPIWYYRREYKKEAGIPVGRKLLFSNHYNQRLKNKLG